MDIISLVKKDRLIEFVIAVKKDNTILKYRYGSFPILSVAILYGSKKISAYLIRNYKNDFMNKGNNFDTRNKFRNLIKGRLSAIYENSYGLIEPAELFLIKNKYKKFISFTNSFAQVLSTEAKERTIKVLDILQKNSLFDFNYKGQNILDFTTAEKHRRNLKLIKKIAIYSAISLFIIFTPIITYFSIFKSITFETNGGTSASTVWVAKGSSLDLPEAIKEGHSFIGWYTDENYANEFLSTEMPSANIKLYAKWEINEYTISFDSSGAGEIEDITQDYNTQLTLPTPVIIAYEFLGWYENDELFTLNQIPARNVSLVAKWEHYGLGTESAPYEITSLRRLINISKNITANYILINDLTIENIWSPIESFAGVLDGNNHTVTFNLNTNSMLSLISTLNEGAVIKDLTINASVTNNNLSEQYLGSIVIQNNGTIDNCTAVNNLTLNESYSGNIYLGGLVGNNASAGVIKNCNNQGNIVASGNDSYDFGVGGIAGYNSGIISDCTNSASIRGNMDFGGITSINLGTIKNCKNEGAISSNNTFTNATWGVVVGGIASVESGSGIIKNCYNTAAISATATICSANAGGIVGQIYSGTSSILECYNTGLITARATVFGNNSQASYAGGITAYTNGAITSCVNYGEIVSSAVCVSAYAGGIASVVSSYGSISYSYNTGAVSASNTFDINYGYISISGGLVGQLAGLLNSCYNTGLVNKNSENDYVGGAIGLLYSYFNITSNCHWYQSSEGGATSGIARDLSGINAITQYSELSSMYALSSTLGTDYFIDVAGRAPKLIWEE